MLKVALLVLAVVVATACTSVDSLKPGVSRGTMEAGFTKTTEGLQLEVRGKSYDQVWDAVERAVAWASKESLGVFPPSAGLTVVDSSKERGIVRTE